MITTVNIENIRQVAANPSPFIDKAISEAVKNHYSGYNIDFEPSSTGCIPKDGVFYAEFLNTFADRLHQVNKTLSVDIASWNPAFWNFALLAQTKVDKFITMDTYAGNFTNFSTGLARALDYFSLKQLGIGLITANPSTNQPFSIQEMQKRFDMIKANGVLEIDIWQCPVPQNWFSFLLDFLNE